MEFFISTLLFGISVGGQYALIAIGYTMVYGILRLINFAHGDVFMVAGLMGIYLTSFLTEVLGDVMGAQGRGSGYSAEPAPGAAADGGPGLLY